MIEEEKKVKEIIDEIKNNALTLGLRPKDSSSLLSSFARIYKETTPSSQKWQENVFAAADFEQRLQKFEEKLQNHFKGKSTLSVYKARARKITILYDKLHSSAAKQTAADINDEAVESRTSRTSQNSLAKLNALLNRPSEEIWIYDFALPNNQDAFLLVPKSRSSTYLKKVKEGVEIAIQTIDNIT